MHLTDYSQGQKYGALPVCLAPFRNLGPDCISDTITVEKKTFLVNIIPFWFKWKVENFPNLTRKKKSQLLKKFLSLIWTNHYILF